MSHLTLALVLCALLVKTEVVTKLLRVLWFCHLAIFSKGLTFALLAFGSIQRFGRDFARLVFLWKEVLSGFLAVIVVPLVFIKLLSFVRFAGQVVAVVCGLAVRSASHTSKPLLVAVTVLR